MRNLPFYMSLHTLKLIWRAIVDIAVIIMAACIVYLLTYPEEIIKVSVDSYLSTRDFEDY